MARRRTFACPHCGEDVAVGALACPGCGSDADSGWSRDAEAWSGDLPAGHGEDEDFDYEEALRREGLSGDGRPSSEALARRRLALVCLALALALLAWLVMR
jgi:hypothetical protein